jgi:hypothetical protein
MRILWQNLRNYLMMLRREGYGSLMCYVGLLEGLWRWYVYANGLIVDIDAGGDQILE